MRLKLKMEGLIAITVIAISICLVVGSALAKEGKIPIKIGVPVPLTGAYASDGDDMVKGVTLAVEEINGRGGLLGRQLEVIVGDVGEMEAEKVVAVGKKLVLRDKVNMLVTGYADSGADVQLIREYDVPYLHMDTTSISLDLVRENVTKYGNVFMLDPPEVAYGLPLATAFTEKIPKEGYKYLNKKVAFLTTAYLYNEMIAGSIKKEIKKRGGEIIIDELSPLGNSEWRTVLTKIKVKKPSIVFFIDMSPTDEATFIHQFRDFPTKSLVYMQYGPSAPEFLDLAGKDADGIIWSTAIAPLPGTKTEKWIGRYEKKFGRKPGFSISAATYDGTYLWADAVKKVGSAEDYCAICEVIRKGSYEGLCGRYVFDPEDQHALQGINGIPTHIYQVQNGKMVLIYPEEFATGKFEVPAWCK